MIRPYLVNGTLAQNMQVNDSIAKVDPATWTYLNNILGTDHGYLVIGGLEPVKVLGLSAPNVVRLARRIEVDVRHIWPAGTKIKYQLTKSELIEATTAASLVIGVGGNVVKQGNQISYPTVSISPFGGVDTGDISEDGTIRVVDIPANAGCECGPPVAIPLQYLLLRVYDSGYRILDDGSYRSYG